MENIGRISITGSGSGGEYRLIVEDNGGAISHERLQALKKLLASRLGEGADSCGLQNVHRRLQLRYGSDAGLRLSITSEAGLRVELRWRKETAKDEAVNRG
ncbi:hypothetical protein D3C80_1689700 [compost metagenome]